MKAPLHKLPDRWLVLTAALCATGLIAWADIKTGSDVPVGLLYLLPAALAGSALSRWQVVGVALGLTLVAELSDSFQWNVQFGMPRDGLYLTSYLMVGLYLCELRMKRQRDRENLQAMKAEISARRDAEEQLRLLVANSSIGIVTADENGQIVQANETAERLYAGDEGAHREPRLTGAALDQFVPSLARVPVSRNGRRHLRTMMQCQGMRRSREPFMADVWFSTYETQNGGRLTAMIVDSSDDVRDREEANLEQMLKGSRLLVGAVSHEIRNVCAAIGLVQSNLLAAAPGLSAQADFQALRQLTGALERMASVELSQVKRRASQLDLQSFFRELRIIAMPSLRDAGIEAAWEIGTELPVVRADHQSLLQVFLNVLRNAQEALRDTDEPAVRITVSVDESVVDVTIADNGPGIQRPDHLFHPFQDRSGVQQEKTGFGLYLSRAMMNSFHGDLRYSGAGLGTTGADAISGQGPGASFVLELMRVDEGSAESTPAHKEMETA